jgi:hypothetical protein
LEPHLPGKRGDWEGIADDNRLFINAVFWILRTELRGEIFLRTTAIGRTHIAGSVVGATREYGKNYWNYS